MISKQIGAVLREIIGRAMERSVKKSATFLEVAHPADVPNTTLKVVICNTFSNDLISTQ